MHVHRSNRTERLVDALAEIVGRPVSGPLAPEVIAVQGRGMERWLAMELSRRLGVWANAEFPFPRHLIQRVLRAFLGPEAVDPRFEPGALRWAIAQRLPPLLDQPEFEPLRRYLEADSSPYRLVQLAGRLADLFDQYVVFRPDMVLRWEAGHEAHWQARLWRALVTGAGAVRHMAASARDFDRVARQHAERPAGMPPRICLFGLSTIAPLYLQVLATLSCSTEIHLFILSPSREYWAEIRSRREVLRQGAPGAGADLEERLRREAGNPLLASFGKLGREFQEILEATADYEEGDADLYVEPPPQTMLQAIQADMLALRYRAPGTGTSPLPLQDDSIAVHSCHSALREVEVLHEQLQHLFEVDPDLDPQDIVVMSPAIDEYAPLVDAVFGGDGQSQHIPYRIADRRPQATEEVVQAFLAVSAVLGTRLTASAVMDLLEFEAVRERFGIAASQLDVLREWIDEAGIRWGIDAEHRRRAGQPPLPANTWRLGLDRLLLGYAMEGAGRRLFGGLLPCDGIEGTAAAPLGALAELCDRLFDFHRDFEQPRTVTRWSRDLALLLEATIASDGPRAHQHREIRDALASLSRQAEAGGFEGEVDLETMRRCLARELEKDAPGRNFLGGGVTFCALVPMRTIPFEVVCLLGMNDDSFPRSSQPLGFDLMAIKPRAGDRSVRDDDRYLFLEALLAARRRLLITYVGQSVHDNTERPPSVAVSELLDTIDESFQPVNGKAEGSAGREPEAAPLPEETAAPASAQVVVRHPLQPFSPRYFRADRPARLVSYSRRAFRAAAALVEERTHSLAPFIAHPLPALAAPREVTVDELARFFERPVQAFLQGRLALSLERGIDTLEDREPIELDSLERWRIGDELLRAALHGDDPERARACATAAGRLPPGALGTSALEQIHGPVQAIAAAAAALRQGGPLPPVEVDVMIGDTRLTGLIRDLWPPGQLRCQYSRVGGRHELSVWLRHLVLNCCEARNGVASYLVGRGDREAVRIVRFRPVADAPQVLHSLLHLYALGQRVPLPLFERASRTYAALLLEGRAKRHDAHAWALEKAVEAYQGRSEVASADANDPYVELAFRNRQPVRDDEVIAGAPEGVPARFSDIALAVYEPLFAHREEHCASQTTARAPDRRGNRRGIG